MKSVAIAMLCFTLGVASGEYLRINKQLACHDFTTSNSIWRGFTANHDGDLRCFWLELSYPYRTKQGVPVK